jgi:hypothetical protein
MSQQAEVHVPFTGQRWGSLHVGGGVARWTLGVDADRSAQPAHLVQASFEGVVPEVRATGATVEVAYSHWCNWWRSQSARVDLSVRVPWSIVIGGGASELRAHLRGLRVGELTVMGGMSDVLLELGETTEHVPIRIHGGVERLTIVRPRGVGLCLRTRGGVCDVQLDATHFDAVGGKLAWQAEPRAEAGTYDVQIGGGAVGLVVARSAEVWAGVSASRGQPVLAL